MPNLDPETIRVRELVWQASQHNSALYLTKHEVKLLWRNIFDDAIELSDLRGRCERIAEALVEAEAATGWEGTCNS